jgi:predicted glycoside hydrolase/deacetylase ChbG (UPF0249 family)
VVDGKTPGTSHIAGTQRYLIVMADDYGIGTATSQGILDLAARGVVTGSVLLVNSPFAEKAVEAWRQSGKPLELGWHPCLTLDGPLTAPGRIPSLVREDGSFHPLKQFLSRLFLGLLRPAEIEIELRAQYLRFRELVGEWPAFMNGQHHVHIFKPVADVLARLLGEQKPLPYVRRVREPWQVLLQVPGARLKRLFLSTIGRSATRVFNRAGFAGNGSLAGVTNPACVTDPQYLSRWLARVPGRVVELACHPGYRDTSLIGRDCTEHDGCLQRRVDEMQLFSLPGFANLCKHAGFQLVPPSYFLSAAAGQSRRAA